RLDDIAKTRLMPRESLERLRYALEFLSLARIRHQALDIQEGREPNNYIEPENVSAAERHGLKDAFQILSSAQKFLRFRYPLSAPGRPWTSGQLRPKATGRSTWPTAPKRASIQPWHVSSNPPGLRQIGRCLRSSLSTWISNPPGWTPNATFLSASA